MASDATVEMPELVVAPFEQEAPTSIPARSRLSMTGLWVVSGRVLGIGVTTLVNIVLARWLSHDDFGSFLLLSSMLALASLVAMVGLNVAVVRFPAESLGRQETGRARRSLRLMFAVAAVTVPSVAIIAAIAMWGFDVSTFGLPSAAGLVPLAVVGLVLLSLLQLLAESCRGLNELRLATLFSGGQTGGLASNFLFLILIGVAFLIGAPSFMTAVTLNVASMAICAPLALLGFLWVARTRLAAAPLERPVATLSLKQLLGFSIPMLMIQMLAFATTQSDLWISGICCPHDQLALYGAARRLVLLVSLPVQMLNLTVISSIAELYGQGRKRDLEKILRGAALFAAIPSLVAIAALLVGGGPILQLLFGSYFREAALPLGILAIGQLFMVCVGASGYALEMTGHQMISLRVNLISAVAIVVVGTLAARQFGIVGLAAASSGVIAAQSLTLWLLAKKVVGVWTHPGLPSLGRTQ